MVGSKSDRSAPDISGYPVMLTKPEVMEITRLSLSGVNRLIADGSVAAFHMGKRKVLVSRSSVEEYLRPFNR